MLHSKEVDGIILQDCRHLPEALAWGIPAIVLDAKPDDTNPAINVVADDAAVGAMAAEHLLACGFRSFAFCGKESSDIRRENFVKEIGRAGYGCHSYALPGCDGKNSASGTTGNRAVVADAAGAHGSDGV